VCYDNRARPPIAPIAGGAQATEELTLTSADGTRFRAFAARATHPSGAGIIILPDIRGLHPFYEELAVRFAENGIDAVAIDYFGRTAGLGTRPDDFEWQPHVAATRAETLNADVAAAAAYLRSSAGGNVKSLFTIGFCFGGALSWQQAANGLGLAGAIGFYGRPVGPSRDGSPAPVDRVQEMTCPILALFGGADPGIPQSAVDAFAQALTAAHVPHEIKVYPGAPHSFFDRHQTQFAQDSADAWQRVLSFIRVNESPRPGNAPARP
jgi:carboxymethylenebutenolidase